MVEMIFYLAPYRGLLTVPVAPRGTTWDAGTPTKLVAGRYFTGATAAVSTTSRWTGSGSS